MSRKIAAFLFAFVTYLTPLQVVYAQNSPEPSATSTAEPTTTATPVSSPTPGSTSTPSPSATSTPTPTATPKPAVSVRPRVVSAKVTPTPTSSPTPEVTAAPAVSPQVMSYTVEARKGSGPGFLVHTLVVLMTGGLGAGGFYMLRKNPKVSSKRLKP